MDGCTPPRASPPFLDFSPLPLRLPDFLRVLLLKPSFIVCLLLACRLPRGCSPVTPQCLEQRLAQTLSSPAMWNERMNEMVVARMKASNVTERLGTLHGEDTWKEFLSSFSCLFFPPGPTSSQRLQLGISEDWLKAEEKRYPS